MTNTTIKFVWSGNDQYLGWAPNTSEVEAQDIIEANGEYFCDETELHICPKCGKYFAMSDWDLDVCPECVHSQVTQEEISAYISEDLDYDPYEQFRGIPHKTISAIELAKKLLA